nr:hypothetical protein [Tanacetum cinerariifolium]
MQPSFASIITHLLPIAKRKSSKSCIGKLVVAAAAYFIWQERNSWLFNKGGRRDGGRDCGDDGGSGEDEDGGGVGDGLWWSGVDGGSGSGVGGDVVVAVVVWRWTAAVD